MSAAHSTRDAIKRQLTPQIATEWKKEADALDPQQDAFDATDRPAIFNSLGCSIFLE